MKSIQWAVLTAAVALGGYDTMAANYDLADLMGSLSWTENSTSPIFASPESNDGKSWSHTTTSLSWNITYDSTTELWSYSYVWRTGSGGADLSHIIFETSLDATKTEFIPEGTYKETGYGIWNDQGNSNPGIPGDLHGFKFDFLEDQGTIVTENGVAYKDFAINFLSARYPTWGDFYAKDGVLNSDATKPPIYAYNKGFLEEDKDDGFHILVPDTGTGFGPWDPNYNPNPTPDAGTTVSLIGLALLGIEGIRRRLS